MPAPAHQSIEGDSQVGEYHSSSHPAPVAAACEGRGGPPPSRTVAFDVVTQGKLWRTLAGFRQLSARGATRGFEAREDQASLATNPARSAMFVEAGNFGAQNGRFYLLHLTAQTGRRRQLGMTRRGRCDEPRSRHVGETEPGKSLGTRSISKNRRRVIPARERLAWAGVSPENERGSWGHRWLAQRA